MPRFDDGVVNSKLEKGDIILMGNPTQYGEILAENFLVEDITRANLQTLISASELVRGKCYRVTNAVGSTLSLIVQALTANTITDVAYNTINGDLYTYNITADTATQGIVSDVVDFDPQIAPAYLRGRVWYDSDTESLSYYDDISGTSNQIGKEEHVRVRNTTGVTITNGSVVYVSGATGQTPQITLAQANADETSNVIGIATHEIANNAFGKVTTFGVVNDVNTLAFAEGSILYLSQSVAGGLTSTRPSAPNFAVIVGICLHSHATQGKILVNTNKQGLGFGTANQLLGINAGATGQEYKTLSGTSNQVTVTNSAGGITLSLPQSIATTSSPTFAGLTVNGLISNVMGTTLYSAVNTGQFVNITAGALSAANLAIGIGGTSIGAMLQGRTSTASSRLHLNPYGGNVLIGKGSIADSGELLQVQGTANITGNSVIGGTLAITGAVTGSSTAQFTKLGLGGSPTASQILRIEANISGSTTTNSVFLNGIIQNDVTSSAYMYRSSPSTLASAFTLADLSHFIVVQGTIGATSAITEQNGYRIFTNFTGGATNYGFRGQIPSGTGRWNIYMDGTAANYLAGNTLIGSTTDGGEKLQVTGTARITDALSVTATGQSILIGTGNLANYVNFAGTRGFVGYDGADMVIQGAAGKGVKINVNNNTFGSGTALTISTTGAVTLGTSLTMAGDLTNTQNGSTYYRVTANNNNGLAGLIITTGNGASLQTWQIASNISGANGEFTIRDSTAGVTALTITKGTNAITLSTALGVASGGLGITTTPSNGFIPIGNGTNYVSAAITGTANQVTVTNGAGTITLSLPQSIATTSTVRFGTVGIGIAAATVLHAHATSLVTTAVSANYSGRFSNNSTAQIIQLGQGTAGENVIQGGRTSDNTAQPLFIQYYGSRTIVGGSTDNGTSTFQVNGTTNITGNTTIGGTLAVTGALSLGTGNAVTASVATPSTHKVAIVINGTTYYLLASNV